MNDSVIHDSGFAGSPVLAYGQAPATRRFSKLLALLAGSFVVCLGVLFVWFWFFSELPIPQDSVILAVVPSSSVLPAGVPVVWSEAQHDNAPLPVVVGVAKIDDQMVPFAVRVFGLGDLGSSQGPRVWYVSSSVSLVSQRSTPFHQFGWPGSHKTYLSLWPGKILGKISDFPEVLKGPIQGNAWTIPGEVGQSSVNISSDSENFVPLGETGNYLSNILQSQGMQSVLPEEGALSWNFGQGELKLSILPQDTSTSTYLALAVSKGIFGLKSDTLPDQTEIYQQVLASGVSSTWEGRKALDMVWPWNGLMNNKLIPSLASCPGKPVASFDETSLKNICSWMDVCYVKLHRLLFNQSGDKLVVCFE